MNSERVSNDSVMNLKIQDEIKQAHPSHLYTKN
ncbi:hypothetical protein FHW89_002339 [Mucilaginibacter sp. SG564]|nr:hypothetical protein [Mucilaginibacter sp. SG564]